MNRKNGFTLIELLAVIVILAIIALIATPIVLNIIEDSKKSTKLNSANHYLDAVEQAIMKYNMNNGGNFIPKECEIQEDGNLLCDELTQEIVVEVDGETPVSGTITFESGIIVDVGLDYGEEYIGYNKSRDLVFGYKTYKNGDVVYYDVTNGKVCRAEEYQESQSATGVNVGCMKFYAFNDDISHERINLILDHDTTAEVLWNEEENFKFGPTELVKQLYNDTKGWKGTETLADYTVDQSVQGSGTKYTIIYSKPPEGATEAYKARLITAQEVAQIVGSDVNLNWNEVTATTSFKFGNELGSITRFGWLYDRISNGCSEYGCLNDSDKRNRAYWTATSFAQYNGYAWQVYYTGSLDWAAMGEDSVDLAGVRPVIEVLKSNLS